MTILLQRRRLSAFIDSVKNLPNILKSSDTNYRSLSTGDLADATPSNGDFMEMEFGMAPTTSSLPAHFDDCEKVPMDFTGSKPKLMPQTSKEARNIAKYGSADNLDNVKYQDIHRCQSWFFLDIEPKNAERILISNGIIENSFLISYHKSQYILSVWNGVKARHLIIRTLVKNGEVRFQLDIDKSFRNLMDLTNYYTKNRGYVLQSKLSQGVSKKSRTRA